jgi:hypothetical protein
MPKTSDMMTKQKSMPRTLEEKLEALEPQRRAAVEAAAVRLQRVSDLLCMSNSAHASPTKEHEDNDDFQGTFRRAA